MIKYGQALYAPSIDIDDNWLKTAALYYEKINRIVPKKVVVRNSDTLKSLISELDFVRNLEPTSQSSIDQEFLDYACKFLAKREQRMILDNLLGNISGYTMDIHAEKMTAPLLNKLVEMGLATPGHDDWYIFDALTGSMYMGFLAKKMAENRALPIVTTSGVFHGVMQSLDSLKEDSAFRLASMVIQGYTIKNVSDVKVEKIVEFRRKYNDEQKEFYSYINELSTDIGSVESDDALQEILEYKKNKIDQAIENIERAGSGIGLDIIRGTFSTIWKLAAGDGFGAMSAGVDTIGVAVNQSKSKDALSYVLALRDELDKEGLAKQLISGKLRF